MASLIGMSGDLKGQVFEFDSNELTIGRSDDNTIIVNNASVSGHHCCIVREGDKYTLRDNGSTNGTRVNSKDVVEAVLKPKVLIQVGSVEFMFNADYVESGPEDEEEEAPPAQTQVEVAPGPAEAPDSFANVSPFGARRKEPKGMWFVLILVVGILALAGVGYVIYKLLT